MSILELFLAALILPVQNFIRSLFVSPSLGIASLPVIPTEANVLAPSVAVAGAIKPTLTAGAAATELLIAKPDAGADCKVVIFRAAKGSPCRILLLSGEADPGVFLDAGADLLGTITRDDETKQSSPHTLAAEAGMEANALNVMVQEYLAAQKPSRNFAGLINAILDAHDDEDLVGGHPNIALVFDQTTDGTLSIYKDAPLDDVSGKFADVTQEAAPADPATPTIW